MSTPSEDPRLRFARTDPAARADDPDLAATLPPADPAATLHLPPSEAAEAETRFGPGVPGGSGTADDRATGIWRGTVTPEGSSAVTTRRPRPRWRRELPSLLVVVAVVVAVIVGLRSCSASDPLHVLDATVSTPEVGRCAKTVLVTGVLKTDGHPGTVDYRWKRSDGTASEVLHQKVGRNVERSEVVLRWSFDGHGTMKATATLEVLSPDPVTASTSFTYACS
ncbi:hypothetical protein GCM10022403_035990 [Streptomyces coacervatus]|uniref:Ig-like domain-containing protein n=1 Tax=Streptomyces coacervatus TaxID=647381 RepID=A0ABP7HQQ6_9ACTN|nr:hypothetical protein [Streptomyces coacervatus]MDF2270972.1 hypothetical protein [Streptomyces coacervatus]